MTYYTTTGYNNSILSPTTADEVSIVSPYSAQSGTITAGISVQEAIEILDYKSTISINSVYVVDSQAEMLALDATVGSVAVRTDIDENFILQSLPASTLDNWVQLLTPTDLISSVNSLTGNVVLNAGDGLTFTTDDSSSGTYSLSASGVDPDSYGNVAQTPYITVDTYGRITAIELNNIQIDQSQVTGLTTDDSPTFTGLTLSSLTASGALINDTSGAISSLAYSANNVVSTLVYRDSFGNFHGNDIYAEGALYTYNVDAETSGSNLSIGLTNAQNIFIGNYNDFSGSSCSLTIKAAITLMNSGNTYPLPINNVYIKQPEGGATLDLANGSTLQLTSSFGLSFVPDRNCTVNYNLVDSISFNQSLQTTDDVEFNTITANNIYSLFANNSLSSGLDQLVLTIDTDIELWYDGTNQQLYLVNNSASDIICTFLVSYFTGSTVTGLTYINSSELTVAADSSIYFSSDGSASSGYNIDIAGYLQNINFLTITVGSTVHKLTGNMNYDGTYNNILIVGN